MSAKSSPKKSVSIKKALSSSPIQVEPKPLEQDANTLVNMGTEHCPTLSGRSSLTYHITLDAEAKVFIRIFSNSGGGYFSNEYVAFDRVLAIVEAHSEQLPLTSMDLVPLFSGKSVNTPGYLLAVLVNEKVVLPSVSKQRQWIFGDVKAFIAKVTALKPKQ